MSTTSRSSSAQTSCHGRRVHRRPRQPRPLEPDLTELTDKAVLAARATADKQGVDTLVLDVSEVLAIVDRFVITSATNTRQVRTIAEEIEEQVKRGGHDGPLRTEGFDDLRWVLLDFGDVVVHVFLDEAREYYDLERLWGDVPRIDWRDGGDGDARSEAAGT